MKDERERKDKKVEREKVIEKGHNTIAVIVKDERERGEMRKLREIKE